MSKVSEHLHELHKAMHQDRADAIANYQEALDKTAMEPIGGPGGPITTFLKAEITRHGKALAHHADKMEECLKTVEAEDLNKLQPSPISRVTPTRTAVLRPGMQPLPANADPLISKILGLNPEDEHGEEISLRQ